MVALITILLWIWVGAAHAATYYVATTGSDANNGSEATPWLTIHKCANTMVAGDTCYVRGGTYSASTTIRFQVSGTQTAPIMLLNYPSENPVINWTGQTTSHRILISNASGENVAMGWITISGFEIKNGYEGMKFTSLHNSTISHNWIHDNSNQGILGVGGHHNLFDRNIINHNGNFATCDAGGACNQTHGMYMHGDSYTITNNLIYDNAGYGIQQNGSSTSVYSAAKHPSTTFAGAANWIVASNTIAYNYGRAGITVWGGTCGNMRIENNIFYENAAKVSSVPQGVAFTSTTCTGVQIRNNHFYGTSPGGTTGIGTGATEGVHYTQSGNVTNVSAPAFVNAPAALPVSPNFTLTASAPVNIALVNEFQNNSTLVVGAHKTMGSCPASITTNKITLTCPLSASTPIQNLSTTGVTVGCTGSNCPGSPSVSTVTRVVGSDNLVEVTIAGIAGNACVATNQNWTISYSSSTGTWTNNDNIGPYSGLHQKIFSFTNTSATNNCTGSGPPGGTASHINYSMDDASGTSVTDSSGNALHGTLVNGAGWAAGKTGTGVKVTGGTTQQMTIPYGVSINPTVQDQTWVVPVYVTTGNTQVTMYVFGTEIGTNQRAYIGAVSGTWRVARQSTSITAAGASNLAVTEGWNFLTAVWDSSTDSVTLYKDGVAGTGGATGGFTTFDFPTNFEAPIIGTGFPSTVTEMLYDDVQIFTTVEDPAALYAAWNAPPPPPAGTLAQAAIQFQGVVLDTTGSPIVIGAAVQSIEVPASGGVVLLFQVHCTNIADCDATAFKLVYAKNGTGVWQQIPDTETADGTWMWGITPEANLNTGLRSSRLTGSCAETVGRTQVLSAQTPSIDLPQDGCVVLAYVVRVGATQAANYFDYKLRTEANLDFAGGYTQTARVRVVNPMTSGIGF